MEEKRSKTLKELAAELLGEKPEDLLNFALYPGGVTLVGKDGRKARLHWEPLVGWQVDEVIAAKKRTEDGGRETGDGEKTTEDRSPETGDGKKKADDRGQETGVKGRKKGGKR